MVRWVKDRFPVNELKKRLISVLPQTRSRSYGHVLRKEGNDWVKKCMEYGAKGSKPRSRPNKTWREVVEKDCQARKLNKGDAVDHNRWRTDDKVCLMIRMGVSRCLVTEAHACEQLAQGC